MTALGARTQFSWPHGDPATMPGTLKLLNRNPITFESAACEEDNIINKAAEVAHTDTLYDYLWEQRRSIEALTAHHLGLASTDSCLVLDQCTWIRGSFNVCIPVEVKETSGSVSREVLMRCSMPHKLAEARYPGTVDEKVSCEVGTYAWMQDNCPHIRIPHLFGFGFSDNRHFTHATHRPFYIRFVRKARRYLCTLLRSPVPSQYTHHPTSHSLRTGYLLLEYFKPSTGQMLSTTWNKHREDPARKQNLFRSMARLILSLARVPQARIGSFRFYDDGTVALANRPLSCSTIILENDGAPRIMQRSDTYLCTDAFVSDMLTFHDHRFLSQPNAVYDEQDCRGQMAVKTLLRALSHHYLNRERRNGPFVLQLTDFHASNIFVDQEWNITGLIDLEWICSLPAEMLAAPYWLTGRGIDQIKEEHLDEFDQVREEFMHIFEEEEQKIVGKEHDIVLTKVMCDMWESKGVWFWYCVESVNAMYFLLESHLCPRFSARLSLEAEEIVSQFWCEDSEVIIARKLADKERYDQELRKLFDGNIAEEA